MNTIERSIRSFYNEACDGVNQHVVRPTENFLKRELGLTRTQLELIYAIIKAIPIAAIFAFAPTWIVVGAVVTLIAVHALSPDSISARNWTAINFGAAGSAAIRGIGHLAEAIQYSSFGSVLLTILSIVSVYLAVSRGLECFENVPKPLDDEEALVKARVNHYPSTYQSREIDV